MPQSITRREFKQEMHKRLYDGSKGTKPISDAVFEALLSVISEEVMVNGHDVSIPQLGGFSAKLKSARAGRAPKTKMPQIIPARTRLSFSTYRSFRDKLSAHIANSERRVQ